MMFFDFAIDPQKTTPNTAQNPTPSTEKAKLKMQRERPHCGNSLSPISQIVGKYSRTFAVVLRLKTKYSLAFDDTSERESKADQQWHDSIPGSAVDDDEENADFISDVGTQQEAGSEGSCQVKRSGLEKAVADGYAESLKTVDGEQGVKIPKPELQNGVMIHSVEQPVNSPLQAKSQLEKGACHHCCCNDAGSEEKMAGISKPAMLEIQDVDDSAGLDPKAIMLDVANLEAAVSSQEVIQLIPGSWPVYPEGQNDRRTSEVADQNQGNDGADSQSTTGDLELLRAF